MDENKKEEAVEEAMTNPQVAEDMKTEAKSRKDSLNAARDAICIPAAREILALMASKEDLMMGVTNPDDAVEYFSDLYMEAVPILQKHNVKMDDIKYVFQIAMQPINLLQDRVDMTLELMYNQCTAYLWGQPDTGMVTINDLDKTLRDLVKATSKKSKEQSTGESKDASPE